MGDDGRVVAVRDAHLLLAILGVECYHPGERCAACAIEDGEGLRGSLGERGVATLCLDKLLLAHAVEVECACLG